MREVCSWKFRTAMRQLESNLPKYRRPIQSSEYIKIFNTPSLAIEIAASRFAALGSEQRMAVLKILVRAGPEGLSIGELGARSGVTGSTLTHHVKILTQSGLVVQEKRGRSIICAAIAYEAIKNLSDFLLNQCCADRNILEKLHSHD
jgi:ArsR family transcriptional regulator, arsenate/arsenite/antimonite-responsive transcriptional repressor